MKVRCVKSGIVFKCDFFPAYLKDGDISHPIFQLSQSELFKYLPRILSGQFQETDNYLYFLALLNSTKLVNWNNNAVFTENTNSIIATELVALASIAGKIHSIQHPSFKPPRISLNKENANLSNIANWIAVWESYLTDWEKGQASFCERERLKDIEQHISSLIKTQSLYKKIRYTQALANWAAQAGNFPAFTIEHPFTDRAIKISDYWKEIIMQAIDGKDIHLYPAMDIEELSTHCMENISINSELAHTLFAALKIGSEKNFSLMDSDSVWDRETKTYKILAGDNPKEQALKDKMIADAPMLPPKRIDYATEFQFLKAKLLYTSVQRMKGQS